MPQSLQTLAALFVLLPGFISARIARSVSSPSQQTELERIVEALILSFFIYASYIVFAGTTLPIEWVADVDAAKVSHYAVVIHRWRILGLSVGAVGLGLGWGLLRSTDRAYSLLRRFRLTEKTNGETVWNNVFYSLEGTVQIGLGDGRIVRGWLSRYSDGAGERSVFLEQASWITEDASVVEIPGPGVLLTEKAEIVYVIFLDSAISDGPKVEGP